MTKKYFFRLLAVVMLPLLAIWFALKWAMFFLGVLAMPDDAALAIELLRWLATTPWWVPGALMLIWLLFLAYSIWPTGQMRKELTSIYGGELVKLTTKIQAQSDASRKLAECARKLLIWNDAVVEIRSETWDFNNQDQIDLWLKKVRDLVRDTTPITLGMPVIKMGSVERVGDKSENVRSGPLPQVHKSSFASDVEFHKCQQANIELAINKIRLRAFICDLEEFLRWSNRS